MLAGKPFILNIILLASSTYFQKLLGVSMEISTFADKNSDAVFIGRSGDMFRQVLQYLRTGRILRELWPH
jgi:hypothetical protein